MVGDYMKKIKKQIRKDLSEIMIEEANKENK